MVLSHMKEGKLLELTPFGTGFIEDASTGARYGFHTAMLEKAFDAHEAPMLDGRNVNFHIGTNGIVTGVELRNSPG